MSGVRAVSWDVDGTLYSLARLRIALAAMALRALLRPGGARFLRDLGRLARHARALERLRRDGGPFRLPADREAVRPLEARLLAPALRWVGPRPGLFLAIEEIRARSIPQVVISDYDAAAKLAALGLADRFAAVHSGERLGALKPSPAPFRAAAAALGIEPAGLLHVGDRDDRDGAGARAAGCRVLILGRDVRSLSEVAAYVGRAAETSS